MKVMAENIFTEYKYCNKSNPSTVELNLFKTFQN